MSMSAWKLILGEVLNTALFEIGEVLGPKGMNADTLLYTDL